LRFTHRVTTWPKECSSGFRATGDVILSLFELLFAGATHAAATHAATSLPFQAKRAVQPLKLCKIEELCKAILDLTRDD